MDLLDQPTHALILNDLAACLARDAVAGRVTEHDLALLRRGESSKAAAGALSGAQVRSTMARARFAAAAADALGADAAVLPGASAHFFDGVLDDLLALAPALPTLEFDESVLPREQWAVPDEFAYTLVEALLKIARTRPTEQARVHAAVSALLSAVAGHLRTDSGAHAAAVKHVPLLHGAARALQDVAYAWTPAAYAQLAPPLVALAIDANALHRLSAQLVILPGQQDAAAQVARAAGVSGPQPPPAPSAYRDALLDAYVRAGVPLSGPFVAWCALSSLVSVLGRVLVTAAGEVPGTPADAFRVLARVSPPPVALDAQLALRVALAVYEDMARVVRAETAVHTELYASAVLASALRLTALAQTALGGSDAALPGDGAAVQLLDAALRDAALADERVFCAALSSAAVLAQARPALAPQLAESICAFAALPAVGDAPPLRAAAARALAAAVQASGRDELAEQCVYTLLGADVPGGGSIAVAAEFARVYARPQFTALVVVLLQQQLDGGARVLAQLVALAPRAPTPSFVDVVQLLSARVRAARSISELESVCAAQRELAAALTAHAERDGALADAATDVPMTGGARKHTLLVEVLQLLAEAAVRGGEAPSELDTRTLQCLLPVLAAVLAHADINPQLAPTPELVYLFRNAWLALTLRQVGGGIGGAAPDDPLTVIALKTPPLIADGQIAYLEEELDYNTLLRQTCLGTSADLVRKDLVALAGARADTRGGLVRVAFVRTVLEVEARRAAGGRVSMVLWYLANGAAASSPLAAPLRAVAERVFAPFVQYLQRAADACTLDASATDEVRNLLVAALHRRTAVREVAHTFLMRLAEIFPELFGRADVVVTQLELLTLLGAACEGAADDVYQPQWAFASPLAGVSLELSDSYPLREHILTATYTRTHALLTRVQALMPQALTHVLLRYLGAAGDADGLGKSVALDFARGDARGTRVRHDSSGTLVRVLAAQHSAGAHPRSPAAVLSELDACQSALARGAPPPAPDALYRLVYDAGALAVHAPDAGAILPYLVLVPFAVGTRAVLEHATRVWAWVIAERPACEAHIVAYIAHGWARSAETRTGAYDPSLTHPTPLLRRTDMSKFNRAEITQELRHAEELLGGHAAVLHLAHTRLGAAQASSAPLMLALLRLVQVVVESRERLTTHALARGLRAELVLFGLRTLACARIDALIEYRLRLGVVSLGLDWFARPPGWTFGGSAKRAHTELRLLHEVQDALRGATLRAHDITTSSTIGYPRVVVHSSQLVTAGTSLGQAVGHVSDALQLLGTFVASEIARLSVWASPLPDSGTAPDAREPKVFPAVLTAAWRRDPRLAVQLAARAPGRGASSELHRAIAAMAATEPHRAVTCAAALPLLLGSGRAADAGHWLLLWEPVSPLDALELLQPRFGANPLVLQYAMRVLEQHPVELVFFYIPQVVQALRWDSAGYIEEFILHTTRLSQLFCHQIIWNMKANTFKDDNAEEPDALKPTLDRIVDAIVGGLSGDAKVFFEREFSFFEAVTSISGKLRPFIKKSKPEKKAKIDEELSRIQLEPGVYLPSNPDSVVVDLGRTSGRPLQSAAKAPFMASFKVRRVAPVSEDEPKHDEPRYETVWQGAIFKVGDDCRQDMLALQVIAQFKNIFMAIGLDVYVNPYRVTATAPGCGVIDLVPNATSRDEMGRAKINDLLTFYTDSFGPVDSTSFQCARVNFIQSMAAYSVIGHILQVRDRHNGNIMIDGEGHLVHIDFGFLFDIGPGGMRFEPYSFKLSHEMVAVMGGHDSPGFRMFEELVVKCFLACRPFAKDITATCGLMLGTDLPSFKGPATLDRLYERFKPELSERDAARHAQALVRDAYGNMRATVYDFIQAKQNSIPYRR